MDGTRCVGALSRFAVAMVTAGSVLWGGCYTAWAQTIQQGAALGQSTAAQVAPTTPPASADSEGNLTFSGSAQKVTTIPFTSLYPASSVGSNDSVGAYTSLYGNNSGMSGAGSAAQSSLATSTSPTGDAYRVLINTTQLATPNLSNDPMLTATANTLGDTTSMSSTFGDCAQTTTYSQTTTTTHVPATTTCETPVNQNPSCQLFHTYSGTMPSQVVQLTDAGGTNSGVYAQSPGQIILETVAYPGQNGILNAVYTIPNPQSVTKAVLSTVQYCGAVSVSINGTALGSWSGIGPGSHMDTGVALQTSAIPSFLHNRECVNERLMLGYE